MTSPIFLGPKPERLNFRVEKLACEERYKTNALKSSEKELQFFHLSASHPAAISSPSVLSEQTVPTPIHHQSHLGIVRRKEFDAGYLLRKQKNSLFQVLPSMLRCSCLGGPGVLWKPSPYFQADMHMQRDSSAAFTSFVSSHLAFSEGKTTPPILSQGKGNGSPLCALVWRISRTE